MTVAEEKETRLMALVAELRELSEEDREEVFSWFCINSGCQRPLEAGERCYCDCDI